MQNLDKILEGLLFLAGDGVEKGIIMEKLQVTPKQLDNAIEILKKRYDKDCGITFITYKDKLQLCGNQKFADDVSVVLNPIRERQLTKSTLEVMAIIAYKQPVTRLDVQEIRGINSDYAIQTLLNYKLIEVVGRKDAVGKPLLFGTTDEFLRHFGINQIEDLPNYDELMKSLQEIQEQNKNLYHEFDIPDENAEQTEPQEAEDNLSDETTENEQVENVLTEKQAPVEYVEEEKEILPNEITEKPEEKAIAENIENNQDIEVKEKIAETPKKEKTKKQEKSAPKPKKEKDVDNLFDKQEQLKQTADIFETLLQEKAEEQPADNNNKIDGIDWSILFDNPDIEQ